MELQELVDRIQRWKQRTESQPAGEIENEFAEENADEFAANATEDLAPQEVDSEVLDFEEMELTELPNGDSGVIDINNE